MLMMLKMVIDAGGVIDAELMEQESLLDEDNDSAIDYFWNTRLVMDEFHGNKLRWNDADDVIQKGNWC